MNYLNSADCKKLFLMTVNSPNFVDKTMMIQKTNQILSSDGRFICITRPRRFGKSVDANMIASYYGVGLDSKLLFDGLNISKSESYEKHLNNHNVIFINFSNMPKRVTSFEDYIEFIENNLIEDIRQFFPDIEVNPQGPIWKIISRTEESYIFVLDEWDYMFHDNSFKENDKNQFLLFLKDLLKDRAYVELAYMTGVLPIAKYSSGSALNMFEEYNFMNDRIYDRFFEFSETEVKNLCKKQNSLSYTEIQAWYNGYFDDMGIKFSIQEV